jgi:hypothetical protein
MDLNSGEVHAQLGEALAAEFPTLRDLRLRVRTVRQQDLIAATTLCEEVAE